MLMACAKTGPRAQTPAGSARCSTALIRDCTQPAPRVDIAPVPTTGGRPSVSLGSSAPAEPSVMMTVAMDEHRAHLSTVKASGRHLKCENSFDRVVLSMK